jgi:hypothetical protein
VSAPFTRRPAAVEAAAEAIGAAFAAALAEYQQWLPGAPVDALDARLTAPGAARAALGDTIEEPAAAVLAGALARAAGAVVWGEAALWEGDA